MVAIGLGWRAWVAFDGDWLRELLLRRQPAQPAASRACSSPASSSGPSSIFALGIMARWLVVHGHLDRIYTRLPARLGVSSFLVLMLPSIALLYWVERGTHYTNRVLFTVYDFVVMLVLRAGAAARGPAAAVLAPARCGRSAPGWASAATASTCGTSRSSWPSTSAARCRRLAGRRTGTGGGCPLILRPRRWSSRP